MAAIGKPPAARQWPGSAARLTVAAVRPRLAGCLCTGTIMDDIVHRIAHRVWRRGLDTGRCPLKAIVVTDQAAGTAGMTPAERPGHFNAVFRADHFMSED